MLDRRQLLLLSAAAGLTTCASREDEARPRASWREGRIEARPVPPTAGGERGLLRLESPPRDAALYVPRSYDPERAAPLLVMLHGAGGGAANIVQLVKPHADRHGIIILGPQSAGATWDLIEQDLGPDVARIDALLETLFSTYRIDASRVAVGGFSDGASYALSLGIMNGDLFPHVVAFSPGFMAPRVQNGRPRFFISHGEDDRVLPIDRCSRRIVPQLRSAGYEVEYRAFDGGHSGPSDIARDAIDWFLA